MTIDFNCDCGQSFSFPADAVGAWLQCPKCRRLNQVVAAAPPPLSPDAPYVLAESTPAPAVSVADLIDTFSRQKFDSQGREKDLRLSAEELRNLKGDAEPDSTTLPLLPRAATGEPVPMLAVVRSEAPITPPLALPPIAVPRPAFVMPHPARLAAELFHYRNAIVLLFVLLFQLLAHAIALVSFLSFAVPLLVAVGALLLAHFGCVVEETGPEARDELPGPLRAMGWNDDLWQPFQRTVAALLICYFPAWLVLVWSPSDPILQRLATGVAIAGSLFFPAVLLTLITSGTALNLRPDRVIGVIIASRSYFRVMLCWAAVLVGYVGGMIAFAAALADALSLQYGRYYDIHGSLLEIGLAGLLLCAGICAVHYFAWTLGLMYRESYADFPWVYQFHVPVNRGKGGDETEIRRARFYDRLDARLAMRRFFGPM